MKLKRTLFNTSIDGLTIEEAIVKLLNIKELYEGWDMTIDVEYEGYDFDVEGTKVETEEEERLRLKDQAITDELYKQNKINNLKRQLAALEEPLEEPKYEFE